MKRFIKKITAAVAFLAIASVAGAQDDEITKLLEKYYQDKLRTEVEVENPTYRPVIGLSTGFMTFWGDVQNQGNSPLLGKPAFKLNLSGFIDRKHNFKWNVFWINGEISGYYDKDINFKTQINQYGVNLEYTFATLFKRGKFNPYLSVGFSPINFSPMGLNPLTGKYDRNLRKESEKKGTKYGETSFTIPVDAGLNYALHDRVAIRLGATYNYTFSDYLDNVSPTNRPDSYAKRTNSQTDSYLFTYLSLNLDLFSDPKTFRRKTYMQVLENEDALTMDQDGDGVFDFDDMCPDTPSGVEVDEKGCPLDKDNDGVPDYLDQDNSTPLGTNVNGKGVAISKDDFAILDNQFGAVRREDAAVTLSDRGARKYKQKGAMPTKFASVDKNRDGDISYEELKQTVNDFLDKKSTFTTQDINELYEYFFAQ